MCWIECQNDKPIKRIASVDIHVQKVVRKGEGFLHEYVSPYRSMFGWRLNKVNTTRLEEPLPGIWEGKQAWVICEGFHSCKSIKKQGDFFVEVNSGTMVAPHYMADTIMDAVIPKGASYYVNSENFYVSNQLMLVKSNQTKNLFLCVGRRVKNLLNI